MLYSARRDFQQIHRARVHERKVSVSLYLCASFSFVIVTRTHFSVTPSLSSRVLLRFVITGCTSEWGSLLASREYVHLLCTLGERINFFNYKVQNIVSSVDMGFPLDLKTFESEMTALTSWESRKFPGLVFRHPSGLVALCFRSGKLVLTGAKSRKSLMKNWPLVHAVVVKYIDKTPDATKCSREYSKQLRREEEKQPFVAGSLFGGMGVEMI